MSLRGPAAVAGLVILIALASCSSEPEAPHSTGPVHFCEEDVTVAPSVGRVRVAGLYSFRNETDRLVEMGIAYPFPVDECHAFPDSVSVTELRDGEPVTIAFSERPASVFWRMRFDGRETRRVRVEYSQALARNRAVYIVTTTAAWGRPIDVAEFHIEVPRGLRDVRLSFSPDTVEDRGDTIVYHLREEGFLPDSDIKIEWR